MNTRRSYARRTAVNEGRSRMEIEQTLARFNASSFMYGVRGGNALIGFEVGHRQIKMTVNFPTREEIAVQPKMGKSKLDLGDTWADHVVERVYNQTVRERWRALALVVKAKLAAIDAGVATFEQEFLPYMVLAGGKTVAEELAPMLEASRSSGKPLRLTSGAEHGK